MLRKAVNLQYGIDLVVLGVELRGPLKLYE